MRFDKSIKLDQDISSLIYDKKFPLTIYPSSFEERFRVRGTNKR